MFRQTPEKLYDKIYAGIEKGSRKRGFSASDFAVAAMRKYLAKYPEDSAQLKTLVEARYKESKAMNEIPGIIMTAYGEILNPAVAKREDDKRVVQAAAPKVDPRPYRILFLGDDGVGKHAIVNGFVDDRFPDDHTPGSVRDKKLVVDGQEIQLHLRVMDEHRRRTMHRVYTGYDAVVFVYDVTNDVSYRNIDNWMAEYDRFGDEGVTRMIVGNKLDFAHKRVTDSSKAKRYADDHKVPYLEVSAITAQNIAKMFTTLGREMIAARQEQSAAQQKRMNY